MPQIKHFLKSKELVGVPVVAQWLTNLTRNHEVAGSVPGLPCSVGWGSRFAVSCGAGRRRGSNPTLLWPWCRPVATAPIQPVAWEPPCASGTAQEMARRQKIKVKN